MNELGLYLHIPFCRSKCYYCDFCSFPRLEEQMDGYCAALLGEMRDAASLYGARPVDTVFFGGGTPTALPPALFSALLDGVFRYFDIQTDAEITTECNPGTVDRAYLETLRAGGVNRLSIGVQSLNDTELRALGRIHTASDAARTVKDARAAGFENISLDLMLGIPLQTPQTLRQTLADVIALAPEHISAYGLKIEDGTPFAAQRDSLDLPDEDTERALYMDTAEILAQNGYARYEISNFAKSGFASRHNLRYWTRRDYLGLGLAAHSCIGADRFSNTENFADYLAGRRADTHETVSPHDILCEEIMLRMRLAEGISPRALRKKYGTAVDPYIEGLSRFLASGLVVQSGDRLAFSRDGLYVSNAILAEILDFEADNDI